MHLFERPIKRPRLPVSRAHPVSQAPIDTLPPELLTHVFSFLADANRRRRVYSRVCHHWQETLDALVEGITVRTLTDAPDAVFDLARLAERFPRLRQIRVGQTYTRLII